MDKNAIQVMLATAFGAFIGALVGLEINSNAWYAAVIGMITGGLTGYLSFDIPAICQALIRATIKIRLSFIKVFLSLLSLGALLTLWFICGEIVRHSLLNLHLATKIEVETYVNLTILTYGLGISITILSPKLAARDEYSNSFPGDAYRALMFCNPLGITLILLYVAYLLIPRIWKATCYTLREIHCSCRLICLADASLGALIGYGTGSALLGALAGTALGLLNYEIVSKRILKLVPST